MNPQLSNAPAGPGAIEISGANPEPMLDGASEYEYVTIFNPLSVDFIGLVGMTRTANVPINIRRDPNVTTVTRNEQDVARNYGLDLKNPSHQGKVNITNRIKIPSGGTVNLLGNEAQVIVRQLVNEILQREGKKLHIADPTARREVELRIIKTRRDVNDILGRGPISTQDQLQEAVNGLNQEQAYEPEFPGVTTSTNQPDQSVMPAAPAPVGDAAANIHAANEAIRAKRKRTKK